MYILCLYLICISFTIAIRTDSYCERPDAGLIAGRKAFRVPAAVPKSSLHPREVCPLTTEQPLHASMAGRRIGKRCLPAVALALLISPRHSGAADEIHWTITGQRSVTFDWRGAESAIRFGRYPAAMNDSVVGVAPTPAPDSSPGPFWEARLTGLLESTPYYYRIGNGSNAVFRTPPPRGSSDFWFAEQADIGSSLGWSNVTPAQAMILEDIPDLPGIDRPRFVLVAGDLTYGDQNSPADVDRHFNDVMVWSRLAAYMPAWGNHEWGTAADSVHDNLNNYEGRFDFPNSQTTPGAAAAVGNGPGEDWYWFDYGNARFISFPEPYDGGWNDWAAQVGSIMADAQADSAITFIITFGHRPAWSSGADHGGESSLASRMAALHAAYPKYLLSLQAHTHHYERTDPAQTGGILFVDGSGGGSSLGGLQPTQPGWSAYRINHLHHVRVHVQEDRIDGYAICGPDGSGSTDACDQGAVIDSFTVLATRLVSVPRGAAPSAGLRVSAEPNPGRGWLALRVETDAPGERVLEVLDASGRRVRRMPSVWQESGARHVFWDGSNDAGGRVPPGIYLVRLRFGDRTAETRVTLLR